MADVVGTYALTSINGHPVPAPFGEGSALIYDTLSLAADSTWTWWYGSGALGSAVVVWTGRYAGSWTLDAATGQALVTQQPRNAAPVMVSYTVLNRGASLTVNTGPVDPSRPGTGLWVYDRVR